ncbi:MAG: sigma 54-interacting transcriptional regulator [Campylobacterota bacterium]|nr:sigma 54-interacting transcriptional regulator [Campylobacterota bacterium]
MKKFIAQSEASKKILNIAQMSSNLPVNVMIIGEIGVGKNLLSQHILPDSPLFEANILEEMIINKTINIDQYKELIILNIDKVLNKKEFLEYLNGIKIVATSNRILEDIESQFAIKIDIPPLKDRVEDLNELISIYLNEANNIYNVDIDVKDFKYDLSLNGISLKRSIYKNISMRALNDEDLMESLEYFIDNKLKKNEEYRTLLKYFEIPLLKSAKKLFKSQLKMATKLNINRITLRKKLELYFGEIN